MLSPMHIATRGRLDGEYGIATRGYIICPDIVPRFPGQAEVSFPLDHVGEVSTGQLHVDVFDSDGWFAMARDGDWGALLALPELEVKVSAVLDLEAFLEAEGPVGEVLVSELEAELGIGGETGVVSDRDAGGMLDQGEVLAEVDENEVPHC